MAEQTLPNPVMPPIGLTDLALRQGQSVTSDRSDFLVHDEWNDDSITVTSVIQQAYRQDILRVRGKDILLNSAHGPLWWDKFIQKAQKVANMPFNWNSYDADPPDALALFKAMETLPDMVTRDAPMPSIHPIPDGGISIEWHLPHINAEVEFTPKGRIIAIVGNLETHEEWDADVTGDIGQLRIKLASLNAPNADES